jgi:hypothetical protein
MKKVVSSPFISFFQHWGLNPALELLHQFVGFFGIGYFWDGVSLYAWTGLDLDRPICASLCCWDDRHTPLNPAIGWDGVLQIFILSWPWTAILPISASQEPPKKLGLQAWATAPSYLSLLTVTCVLFLNCSAEKLPAQFPSHQLWDSRDSVVEVF